MEKEELVDVLLTTYNSKEEYLRIQIESILNQTHQNMVLYISDDCSPNQDVVSVLKEYEEKDHRVRLYLQEKNLGYNKNFEFLLKQSTADYIAFCDHDDNWYPTKIEESLKKLKESDVDLVYTDANHIDETGEIIHESYLRYKNMPFLKGKNNILAFSRSIAIGCSQMITKSVKEKMLPFTDKVMAHDWISMYIASAGKGVDYIDKALFGYRLHNNNVFGGRSFAQNIQIWKEKHGKSYQAYLQYRDKVIQDAYLDGVNMCIEYSNNKNTEEKKVIQYYEKIKKVKIINLRLDQYIKYLGYAKMGKRFLKEVMIFHFPLLSYLVYRIS